MTDEKAQVLSEEYVGKNMSWKQVQELIPNMWVAISKNVMDDEEIIDGTVLDIVGDKDVTQLIHKYANRPDVRVERTSVGINVGYLNGIFVEKVK